MPTLYLENEIHEQPAVIKQMLLEETRRVGEMVSKFQGAFDYVMIAARGTSDNAARYAQYLFGAYNHLPVALATPSLFTLYEKPPSLARALVIGISQSGQSPDIVSVLAEGKRQGRPTLAITNNPDSPLAKASDNHICLHAGVEKAVAATKTYTASLAAMALLSCQMEGDEERLEWLQRVPDLMRKTFVLVEPGMAHVERYRFVEQCAIIGRGFNYSTAFEISLKVKELTGVVTVPYSSADFRHGPIRMVHSGVPVLSIAPGGGVSEDMRSLFSQLKDMGAEQLVISDQHDLLHQAQLGFPLPGDVPEWLTPMLAVLPGQMFGMILAREKGFDPDNPRGLTKVTETF